MKEKLAIISRTTKDRLIEAYSAFRAECDSGCEKRSTWKPPGERSWQLAADWVESNSVDPYEYIRAQFLKCDHGIPFVRGLASERARENYFEIIGTSKSFQLAKFSIQTSKLLNYVQRVGADVDQVLLRDPEFMAVVRILFCTEKAIEKIEKRFLDQAKKEVEFDRELRKYIKKNHNDRSKRILREGIPVKLAEPLVEVGPVQRVAREGFLSSNRPRRPKP